MIHPRVGAVTSASTSRPAHFLSVRCSPGWFFGTPGAESLADGYPRRGLSVVAALSQWLIHASRRRDGSWPQRYEHGVPSTGLVPAADDGTTGTTVRFYPDRRLRGNPVTAGELVRFAASWRFLAVAVDDRRAGTRL
jgi:topoisomerase-4 subunit B